MAYFNRFSGDYDTAVADIERRRQALLDKAKSFEPENMDELVASTEDGVEYPLEWVNVPNPRSTEGDTITVRPTLSLAQGYEDAEREKDRSDRGAWKLGLETRLPSGDMWYIGDVMFFYTDGKLKHEPAISLNQSPTSSIHMGSPINWESADAELLLALAEGALENQPA